MQEEKAIGRKLAEAHANIGKIVCCFMKTALWPEEERGHICVRQ